MKLIETLQEIKEKHHKVQLWIGNGILEGYVMEVHDDCIKMLRSIFSDNTILISIAHISAMIDLDQETIDQ